MTRSWVWLLAAGCEGGTDGPSEIATLAVQFDGEPSSDVDVVVDLLQVTVDRLWFEGEGPAGQESVVLDVDETFSVLGPNADAMELALRVGGHDDAVLTLEAAVDGGGMAIVATGQLLEPDDDEIERVPFRVEVNAIEIALHADTVHVPGEGVTARVRLRPTEWLEGLAVDDDDGLDVGPGSGPAYDRLLTNILGAVTLDAPEPSE